MDDPWDSPWATDGRSASITPTILVPTKHDRNAEQDEGFSSPKQKEWESGEWYSDPWTRNADSAISLGENTSKLDGDQEIWRKPDDNDFKKQDEDVWGSGTSHVTPVSNPIGIDIWDKNEDEAIANNTVQETNGWTTNDTELRRTDESVASPSDTLNVKKDAGKRLSKVQELVTMYNDMAAVGSTSDLGKESDAAEESSDGALAAGETATVLSDSEDEQASESEPDTEAAKGESVESKRHDRDEPIEEAEEAPVQEARDAPEPEVQPRPELKIVEPKPDGLAYPIDLSHLDELLPSTRPMPRPNIVIPDSLPADSFTNIAQRKTWYRMSRYGSSRKHDTDEGYTRVTWANSQIRTKTIQIVRRWMEQDSIAGRVVLGGKAGGAIGASLFNWDSNEPAVQIGELLKKRRDLDAGHTRFHSAPTREPLEKSTEWTSSVPATPAVGVFDQATIPKSPWEEDTSQPPTPLFKTHETVASENRQPSPMMPPTPFVVAQTQIADASQEEHDDDDDWGEMMTSPTVQESVKFGSMIPSDQPQESKDVKNPPTIQVSQPEPKADDWDFGGWASPSVEKTPTLTIDEPKIASPPVAHITSPAVTSPFADDGGWDFGEMSFFDTGPNTAVSHVSAPVEENKESSPPLGIHTVKQEGTFKQEEPRQRGEVNIGAVASALRQLPSLAYMLN